MSIRSDDRRIHEVLLGGCIHRKWSTTSQAGRDWVEIHVKCEDCRQEISWARFSEDDLYFRESYELGEEERRRRARNKLNNIDWPEPGKRFSKGVWTFGASEAQGNEFVRQLEAKGWHIVVRKEGTNHICTLHKGAIRAVSSSQPSFHEALYDSAVRAARSLAPVWRDV